MGETAVTAPLSFKTRQGKARAGVIVGRPGRDVVTCEARQMGHHLKEAVVEEGSGGSAWRTCSDEGVHLGGTDLAPFPLGFFNAGLQSDLAGRVARIARQRSLSVELIAVGVTTQYALAGSFAAGTGVGYAEAVGAHVAFEGVAGQRALAGAVEAAIAESPLLDLVRRPLENTFSLTCNGRRRVVQSLPASAGPLPLDPFLKYPKAPMPLEDGSGLDDRIVKGGKVEGDPAAFSATPGPGGRVTWAVTGEGYIDPRDGLYRCGVALNRPGTSRFAFLCDETGQDRAPSGLALASAGIAFCYMTQLTRYIEAMKLAVSGVRLVQLSPYGIEPGGAGRAMPCDTHLFMQGDAEPAAFERLQHVAATTCYLHRTMVAATPLKVTASIGDKPIPL